MELSYGWTSCLAQGLPAHKDQRARPALKGQQVPRAPQGLRALQALRVPQVLKAQRAKMLTLLNSTLNLKSISCLPPRLLAF